MMSDQGERAVDPTLGGDAALDRAVVTAAPCRRGGDGGGSPIRVVVEPTVDHERLAVRWRALERRADASMFLSWFWIGTWLRTVDVPVSLATAHADGRCVGLALLAHRRVVARHLVPTGTLFLHETGDPARDVVTVEYNDVLAERGRAEAVRAALLARLLDGNRIGGRRYDVVVWRGAVGALTGTLDALGLRWRSLDRTASARVDLAAHRALGKPYLDGVSANTRRQIRRARALYADRGPLCLDTATTVPEALRWFRAATELNRRRRHQLGERAAADHPFYVAFHEDLIARGLPARVVELVRVRAGETPIGYLYNFVHRRHVYFYTSGFAFEADNRLKPGLVAHAACIERHLAGEAEVYDFMGGDERYKLSLGHPGPDIIDVAIERPRLRLRVEAALRHLKRGLAERRRPAPAAPNTPATTAPDPAPGRGGAPRRSA